MNCFLKYYLDEFHPPEHCIIVTILYNYTTIKTLSKHIILITATETAARVSSHLESITSYVGVVFLIRLSAELCWELQCGVNNSTIPSDPLVSCNVIIIIIISIMFSQLRPSVKQCSSQLPTVYWLLGNSWTRERFRQCPYSTVRAYSQYKFLKAEN
jgi:hypothetical protein